MIFTTFGNAVIIQQEQLQNAQNTYQVKDKDHVNILSDFFSKFLLKKLEKFGVEKPIFSDGGGNPPPPGTQRVKSDLCVTRDPCVTMLFITDNVLFLVFSSLKLRHALGIPKFVQ